MRASLKLAPEALLVETTRFKIVRSTVGSPKKSSIFRQIRNTFLVVAGLVLLVLLEPHLFRFAVSEGILFQSARQGIRLQIGEMEGSIFEPLLIRDIHFTTSRAAVVSKVSIHSATVNFSWKALVIQRGQGFFNRLTLDTVNADVSFQPYARETGPAPTPAQELLQSQPWIPAPLQAEVFNSNFVFHLGNRTVSFADVRFSVSSLKAGIIAIEKFTFEQDRFSRKIADEL